MPRPGGGHLALSLSFCCAVMRAGVAPHPPADSSPSLPPPPPAPPPLSAAAAWQLLQTGTKALISLTDGAAGASSTVLHANGTAMAEDALHAIAAVVVIGLRPGAALLAASAASAAATSSAAPAQGSSPKDGAVSTAAALVAALRPWLVHAQASPPREMLPPTEWFHRSASRRRSTSRSCARLPTLREVRWVLPRRPALAGRRLITA